MFGRIQRAASLVGHPCSLADVPVFPTPKGALCTGTILRMCGGLHAQCVPKAQAFVPQLIALLAEAKGSFRLAGESVSWNGGAVLRA